MPDPLKNAARTIIGSSKGTAAHPAGRAAVPPTGRVAPIAGAARPPQSGTSNLPRPTPLRRPTVGQAVANIRNVAPTGNGSVYFMPYKYYLSSSSMVFGATRGWNEYSRYQEFLAAMRNSMSGDYNVQAATVVCRIFEQDMQLMFYEKAIQEIQVRNDFNLTPDQISGEHSIPKTYCRKLMEQKAAFSARKKFSPPPDFKKQALWFASVSNHADPYLNSTGEHAGSIYFDGGRIRLMHTGGPILERGTPARTLNGTQLISQKPNDARVFDNMIHQIQQRDGIGATTLIEYYGAGVRHISRGYPKTVNLSDEDIAQLYYLAERITLMQEGERYQQLSRMGVGKQDIINAGNKLMADFIRNRGGLRAALGY